VKRNIIFEERPGEIKQRKPKMMVDKVSSQRAFVRKAVAGETRGRGETPGRKSSDNKGKG